MGLNYFFSCFIAFLLFHGFYIPPFLNSSLLAPFVLFFLILGGRHQVFSIFSEIIQSRWFVFLLYLMVFLCVLAMVISVVHQTYDLSYASNFVMQIIMLFVCALVAAYVFAVKPAGESCSQYAERIFVATFCIQTFIQIFAFLNPNFLKLVHFFYTQENLTRLYNEYYAGARGVGLHGSPGWGLAVGYGLAFIFFVKRYVIGRRVGFYEVAIGLTLFVGSLFSGRTSMVGILIGFILYVFSSDDFGRKIIKIFSVPLAAIFLCVLVVSLVPSFWGLLVERVFPFAFEFYYAYEEYGQLETRSTNTLIEMWDAVLMHKSWENFMFGDGYFTDPMTEKYYMGVDSGILRNILFGGVAWWLIMILYQLFSSGVGFVGARKFLDSRLFVGCLTAYCVILDLKAMTVGFNKFVFLAVAFYSMALLIDRKILVEDSVRKMA